MGEVKHARFSPSKLEELERCPRFERVPDTGAADEGILLHKAYETEDLSDLTQEQEALASAAIEYTNSVLARYKSVFADEREVRLEIPELTYGFADRVIIGVDSNDRLVGDVLDAKFGRLGATKVEENFQVHTYCAALFIRERAKGKPLAEVRGHIVAPRMYATPYGVPFTEDLVEQTTSRIKALYEKLHHPFIPPVAHEDLCARCRWAGECPALNKTVAVVAKGVGLPAPAVFEPGAMIEVRDRAIAQILVKALTNWAEQVNEHNVEHVRAGGEIPGFKFVTRSTGSRVPTDLVGVAWQKLTNQGYTIDRLMPAIRISIPELAKAEAVVNGTSEAEERTRILQVLGDAASAGTAQYLQQIKKFDFSALLAPPEEKGGAAQLNESLKPAAV